MNRYLLKIGTVVYRSSQETKDQVLAQEPGIIIAKEKHQYGVVIWFTIRWQSGKEEQLTIKQLRATPQGTNYRKSIRKQNIAV